MLKWINKIQLAINKKARRFRGVFPRPLRKYFYNAVRCNKLKTAFCIKNYFVFVSLAFGIAWLIGWGASSILSSNSYGSLILIKIALVHIAGIIKICSDYIEFECKHLKHVHYRKMRSKFSTCT